MGRLPERRFLHLLFFCVLMMRFVTCCDSCGPGRTGLKRTGPLKKYHNKPLREKQYVPSVDEFSYKASGPPEGKILRKQKFKFRNNLVYVDNPNVVFRDEERSGADRYMTRRCKEKLDILAVMVRNEWPDVRLLVTEAYDENYAHSKRSLHYEGRALDIKTDDRDRKKYGTLGRLAVQAGFDWVFFESKAHIHVSCKSDNGEFLRHLKDERCFHAYNSTVVRKIPKTDANETVSMIDLKIGDQVLATDSHGTPVFSELIAWLDSDLTSKSTFLRIHTANGLRLTITPSHLIHVLDPVSGAMATKFAGSLQLGDHLFTLKSESSTMEAHKIVAIGRDVSVGSMAPLTRHGTILVNRISASCYAAIENPAVAHSAFAPLRWWTAAFGVRRLPLPPDGIHPYAKLLTFLYDFVLVWPSQFLFDHGLATV